MIELAPGVHGVPGRPAHAFNAYVVDGVLVDARTRWHAARLLRALRGVTLSAHLVTHAHADHQGASAAVCRATGVPLLCGAGDAAAIEAGDTLRAAPVNAITRLQQRHWAGPAHPVARTLREGDEVAGFTVLQTPGHSPGHVALWRERDRVLIGGDAFFGQHPVTGRPGPHPPPRVFTLDPDENRRSARRLAELRPQLACFGHGPPVRDPGALAAALDRD